MNWGVTLVALAVVGWLAYAILTRDSSGKFMLYEIIQLGLSSGSM